MDHHAFTEGSRLLVWHLQNSWGPFLELFLKSQEVRKSPKDRKLLVKACIVQKPCGALFRHSWSRMPGSYGCKFGKFLKEELLLLRPLHKRDPEIWPPRWLSNKARGFFAPFRGENFDFFFPRLWRAAAGVRIHHRSSTATVKTENEEAVALPLLQSSFVNCESIYYFDGSGLII